ncbi:PAS domain-containing sensor histidine kinase [Coraliomargarita sp. SDUM461004]|uniref:histidine kinase n=1 Tax=Thalassobacterium sedimentorum TaxID=3041258 RepID=A0ABU1AHN7_9BACT|nr:PAS domain-containing sensor histidine kinase [Coraliomargarita sp. SDUM461004]MDQ8194334.1 PAS domain-containing sensor histidine kinase [Coraliomargarita sp. SDUM461004]
MTSATESELRKTIHDLEQRLEIALLSANQVWWEWDLPTGILKTHAIKDCILGYDLGKIRHHEEFWMDALPPEEREPVRKSLREHLDGENDFWEMEHRYRDPAGEYKWVLEAGKVLERASDGSPLRMVGITQRIHEKKQQEQALKEKNEELIQALKLKDMLLAGAAHDVKNALTAGICAAGLLREQNRIAGPELELIEDSLRQSAKLIASVQELAAGQLTQLEDDRVDLTHVIQSSSDFYRLSAQAKGLDLRTQVQVTNIRRLDGSALRRILDNLVGNAIKFTSHGEVSIVDRSTGNEVIIEVLDTGRGIPHGQHEKIFVPFNRLASDLEGSGLGLSICQNLANKLGGQLAYHPNRPTGSIFRLNLPISAV